MARSSNQPADHIPATPRSPAPSDTANGVMPEASSLARIPLMWRIVFLVFMVTFAILVLYIVIVDIDKIIHPAWQ